MTDDNTADVGATLSRRGRWSLAEILFWVLALATLFLLPERLLFLNEIANQAGWLTGGADGLQGITVNPIFGIFEFDIFGTTAYAYSLTVTFLLFVIARRLVVSPFGLSLCSIRDNPLRARAIGIPVNRRAVVTMTV